MKHTTKNKVVLPRPRRNKRGFTLLELLVVVAILAIIGGGLIAAYDGLRAQAAKASATNTIASLTNTVRSFNVLENSLPNNVESLLAATPNSPVHDPDALDSTSESLSGVGALSNILGSKLAGKFTAQEITSEQLANLTAAGITQIRYIDAAGDDETESDLTIKAADGNAATAVGPLSEISIPQRAFEAPRPGNGRNRGRGFALDLSEVAADAAAAGDSAETDALNNGDDAATAEAAGDAAEATFFDNVNASFAVWSGQDVDTPTALYNNKKVGADPSAVLVGLGIGLASNIVSAVDLTDGSSNVGNARLASAPYYGDVGKNEYSHYIMLVDVNQNPAALVAVVDPRGDFLDEEFAESTGQKQ